MPYANEKIRETYYSLVNTTYNLTQDMINKLQSLMVKKLEFYQNISNLYDEMNTRRRNGTFQFEEDVFSKSAQGKSKIYDEVLLLLKFLQTKPQIKSMNINYYDLFYTVFKIKNEKEIVRDEYENIEIDYIKYEGFIIPNHHVIIKHRGTILK